MSTWILLRGLARERRHWGPFPGELRNELPGIRVITLDLPGCGSLNDMSSPLRVPEMAAYCRAELLRHAVKPPYHLLAMSLGGMVATAWAGQHPEEIGACVLINTSFGSFSRPHRRLRPRAWPMLLALLAAPTARHREEIIFRLTSNLAEPACRVLDEWVVIRESRPVSVLNALRQLLAAARFRAPSALPGGVLILASTRDRLVDPQCSMDIARRWNCAIVTHPVAGHDIALDDGPWVAAKVREWLASSSEGP